MKKSRDVSTTSSSKKKSFYELSISLIFSLWCLVFLFYTRFGHSHSNRDSYIHDSSNNHRSELLLELNASDDDNDLDNSLDYGHSIPENSDLEEVVKDFLGEYAVMESNLQPHKKEQRNEKSSPEASDHALNDFSNITVQANPNPQQGNIACRLEKEGSENDYASAARGAKVLAHNKEAKGASDILGRDKDKYLRNPCSAEEKFVIIELSDETLVDSVQIGNLEHYSSNFKDFELLGSSTYPTKVWTYLGNFAAENVKHAQRFMLSEPKWVRYLRLNLFSHYGSEFYCTLSFLEVYGVDAIEQMLEDLIVVPKEPTVDQYPPNSIEYHSPRLETGYEDRREEPLQVQDTVDSAAKGITKENADTLDNSSSKSEVLVTNVPDPMKEVRQKPVGRIPSDTVLKILMQKVKTLELNFSVLDGYIKETNRRYRMVLPNIEEDLSQNALVLEKTLSDIKDIVEWKEIMEKRLGELASWKTNASSQIDALVQENAFLRSSIEKVLSDQATMEDKELVVIAATFSVACVSFLKLLLHQIITLFRPRESDRSMWTSKGWFLILISSSITTIIALLYN